MSQLEYLKFYIRSIYNILYLINYITLNLIFNNCIMCINDFEIIYM